MTALRYMIDLDKPDEHQIGEKHPVLVVLIPQHGPRQVAVERSMEHGDVVPLVPIDGVDAITGNEEKIENRNDESRQENDYELIEGRSFDPLLDRHRSARWLLGIWNSDLLTRHIALSGSRRHGPTIVGLGAWVSIRQPVMTEAQTDLPLLCPGRELSRL
jgi:hypothetical protein